MMKSAIEYRINQVAEDLYLIILAPPIMGFKNFIGVWLYKNEITFLVDVGPSVCFESLKVALQEIGVSHLDYILLTHIHIDHAGACGNMAAAFPDTPIICHQKGIPHLADPDRLQEGTLKTLGEIGRQYGPFQPVPFSQMMDAETFSSDVIIPVATPGHAVHHVSFNTGKYLFAGEAGGVYVPLSNGQNYMRPATPPPFFFETSVNSIHSLLGLKPQKICYGHLAMAHNAGDLLKRQCEQLILWRNLISEGMKQSGEEHLFSRWMAMLIEKDDNLAGFWDFNQETRQREQFFLQNSIKGFYGYLKAVSK